MIIVAGWLRVAAEDRGAYLERCRSVVESARTASGCIDFSLSPDLIDLERINVFEQWETIEAVHGFRGTGTSDDQQAMIIGAHVVQSTVVDSTDLT